MTKQEIISQIKEAEDELQALENQYVGHTPAQQRTLDLLKNANISYRQEKEVLTSKIQYLKALLNKQKTDDSINQSIYDDCYCDAMMDDMF